MGLSLSGIVKGTLDFGSRAYDQLNPFDAGLSYKTRKVNPSAAKASIGAQWSDIYNANSPQDIRRRLQQQREAGLDVNRNSPTVLDYRTEQRNIYGRNHPFMNVPQQIFGTTARLANTADALRLGVSGLGRAGWESLFGSDKSYQDTLNDTRRALDNRLYDVDGGLLRAGSLFGSREDYEKTFSNPLELTKKIVGTGLGTAGEVVPIAQGGKYMKLATQGASSLGRTGARFGVNALEAGVGNIGEQVAFNERYNPQETLIAMGIGGTIPTAMYGTGRLYDNMTPDNAIRKAIDDTPFIGESANKAASREALNNAQDIYNAVMDGRIKNISKPAAKRNLQIAQREFRKAMMDEKNIGLSMKDVSELDNLDPNKLPSSQVDPELNSRLQQIRLNDKYGFSNIGPETEKLVPDTKMKPDVSFKQTDEVLPVKAGNDVVDPRTGEILEPAGLKKGDFIGTYEGVDPMKLSPMENTAVIDELRASWNKGIDTIVDYVERTTGEPFENFSKAVQEYDRLGTPIPDNFKSAAQVYKATMDRLKRILPEGEYRDLYIPQTRVGDGDLNVQSGSSLILDTDAEFNFLKPRTNAIPLDELDYSDQPLRRLGDQFINDKFKHRMAVDNLVEKQAAKGIEITPQQASKAIDTQAELGKEIARASQEGGIITSGMERINLVEKVNELGRLKGVEQESVGKSLSWSKRQFSSSQEIYEGMIMPSGRTMSKEMGFDRFIEAHVRGNELNAISNGVLDATELLEKTFKNADIDPDVKSGIIIRTNRRLKRASERVAKLQQQYATAIDPDEIRWLESQPEIVNPEIFIKEWREVAFEKANKDVARQELVEMLERYTFEDKQLVKNLDYDVKRMLTQDMTVQSMATKATNLALGAGHQGALGWNFLSAFQNITEIKRIFAEYNFDEFKYAVRMAKQDPDILTRYGIGKRTFGNILEEGGAGERAAKWKPMAMFDYTEGLKDRIALHAAERRYTNRGLSGVPLVDAVSREGRKIGLKYGQAGSLGFSKSKLGRLFGQFMQYSIKESKLALENVNTAFVAKNMTVAQRKQATKYLAKLGAANTGLYLALNAAWGASWDYVAGVINPPETYVDKDAGIDEKVISRVPGGPALGIIKDFYLGIREEMRAAEEQQREADYSNSITNKVKRDVATLVPGGNQIFNKTGSFIADLNRGYNENYEGRARFATPEDVFGIAKGLLLGKWSTSEAQDYFGNSGIGEDLPFVDRGGQQKYPVDQRTQEKIDATKDKSEIRRLIEFSREKQQDRRNFEGRYPDAAAIYGQMYSSVYNPRTGKYENDVVSPEKWKYVASDKTMEVFNYMKDRRLKDAKEFGDAVDPIFLLSDDERIREVLELRSRPTGDDIEREEILRATTDWYEKFEKAERDYYDSLDFASDPESKYGNSERKQAWLDLGYAEQPPLVEKYFKLRETDPEAAKAMFKNTNLSDEFDKYTEARLEIINAKRALEGYPPIDQDTFNNVTFGYEDDERKVFNELLYGGSGFGSYTPKTGSRYRRSITLDAGGTPYSASVSAKKPRIAPAVTMAKTKPKVTLKRSRV